MTITATSNVTKNVQIGYNPQLFRQPGINGYAHVLVNGRKFPEMLADYHFRNEEDVKSVVQSFIKKGFDPKNIKINGQPAADTFFKQ